MNHTGGGVGVACIHNALLPNNKLLCFERPHIAPVSSSTLMAIFHHDGFRLVHISFY
jgi:hypothetical protein